jgi:hypothetical protein
MYKKKAEPKKRKVALMVEGYHKSLEVTWGKYIELTPASIYFPDKIS